MESGRFELQWASSRFHSFTLFHSEPGGYNPEVAFTSHKKSGRKSCGYYSASCYGSDANSLTLLFRVVLLNLSEVLKGTGHNHQRPVHIMPPCQVGAPGWTRTTDVSLWRIYSPLQSPLCIPTHIKLLGCAITPKGWFLPSDTVHRSIST